MDAPIQEGIGYVSWWSGQYSQPDADLALADIRATGAEWISLLVTQYQDTVDTTTIYPTAQTPPDADLAHAIADAHALGLKVTLKPHLDPANDPGTWRGMIGRSFGEAEWAAWFASYRTFISRYAQLAEDLGVEQFVIGTELSVTEAREAEWRDLVAHVRTIFSGPIIYTTNWDRDTAMTWWDAVDYIGIDAYYPLTSHSEPTVAELKTAWGAVTPRLAALAQQWDRRIIIMELGYRSLDGALRQPWDMHSLGAVDLQEQVDGYQATFESLYGQPWLAGLYWWAWRTDPFDGGPCDNYFTPNDKPAEEVLRAWYAGSAPPPADSTVATEHGALTVYNEGLTAGWQNYSYGGTTRFTSVTGAYSGTQAISATLAAGGAVSIGHAGLDTRAYDFVELAVRAESPGLDLRVYASDASDMRIRYRPIADCRYTGSAHFPPGAWMRVRIPLTHLGAADQVIRRISLKNFGSGTAQIWVDSIRFLRGQPGPTPTPMPSAVPTQLPTATPVVPTATPIPRVTPAATTPPEWRHYLPLLP